MADPRALAGLLDRANQVFSLAHELGYAFQTERREKSFYSQDNGWPRYAATFESFCAAILSLTSEMQHPPAGFEGVAKVLLEAARVAQQIRNTVRANGISGFPYHLDFFPHLNSISHDGYQAVKAVTKTQRLDDPFAFLDESKAKQSHDAGGGSGGNAVGEIQNEEQYASVHPTLQDPRGGGGSEAGGKESIAAFCNAFRDALQMTKGYLADKASGKPTDWPQQEFDAACGVSTAARSELERLTGKPTGWLNGLLDDLQRASRLPADECLAFARLLDDYEVALYRGLRQARCDVGEPAVMAEVSPQVTPAPAVEPKKKRSTEKGEARHKLISALTMHHQYADGGCLNLTPVGNNELARLAKVSQSSATAFFDKQFQGLTNYRSMCDDTTKLVAALKILNQEFTPYTLFGQKPPNEDDRDEDG